MALSDKTTKVTTLSRPRIALVHEYFCNLGGADTMARVLHEMFPTAPIYTLQVYDRNRNHEWLRGMDLVTSFIQRLPLAGRTHAMFLPLMPFAIEQFDLSEYDIIISSSSMIAKGVIPPPEATHFSYTHTRQRVAWDLANEYVNMVPRPMRFFAKAYIHQLRIWDFAAAQRVDHFIANSNFVARRIHQLYRREATVIPEPVDTGSFVPMNVSREGYYLVVGRLVRYKRFDLAVEACKRLDRPLCVIGDGPERRALETLAGAETQFLGVQSHAVIREHLARTRALLFPGVEDFGIAPVEALAMGCPVIAYGAGGTLDTLQDGVTGVFFREQTVEGLIEAISEADTLKFDAQLLRESALRFSVENFKKRLFDFIYDHIG